MQLPQLYRESILKDERRKQRAEKLQEMKLERILRSETEKKERERKSKEERQRKLKAVIEAARLRDQAKRNSARVQQEFAEMIAYEKQYGKVSLVSRPFLLPSKGQGMRIPVASYDENVFYYALLSHQFGRQLALWHRESDEIHNK